MNSNVAQFLIFTGLAAAILLVMFWPVFKPEIVLFSNDGCLGSMIANQNSVENLAGGAWIDLNSVGYKGGEPGLMTSVVLRAFNRPDIFISAGLVLLFGWLTWKNRPRRK
jgi:hypothetical protein